jgi:hypothetical protein
MADQGKTRTVIAVADDVGYVDADGNAQYVSRGTEFEIPEKDWKRHGVRTPGQLNDGNFPAVVETGHPHTAELSSAVTAAENPMISLARLRAIFGGDAKPLLYDPALQPVDVPSTTPAPPAAAAGLSVDWTELSKDQLAAVATAAGIDAAGMKKDALVAALNAASAGAGVTPRVGADSTAGAAETGSSGSEG